MKILTLHPDEIVHQIRQGSIRVAAKLITAVENQIPESREVLKRLYLLGQTSHVVGITGPPGSGKSTIVDGLIHKYRASDKTVAVLAVDPSSPYSGGAILGDRVRMSAHDADSGVFIRSMASRGSLGGVAQATAEALLVLGAMSWDMVLLETVGVGQNEIDVVRHASTVVLTITPESGDVIQTSKAGIMEIADVYVVNKSDLPNASQMSRAVRESVHADATRSSKAVIETKATTTEGLQDLIKAIDAHATFLETHPDTAKARARDRLKHWLLDLHSEARSRERRRITTSKEFSHQLDLLLMHKTDPYASIDLMLKRNYSPPCP